MPTVVVRHDLPIADRLAGERDDLTVVDAPDRAAALDALAAAEAFVVNPGSWDDAYVDALGTDDWVQATSAGYDAFPIDAFRERGIAFTTAAGLHDPAVAEHAFALALAFSRRLPALIDAQRAREWDRTVGLELSDWAGSELAIFGLGNIGEAVARRGLAFGMAVSGIKRHPDDYDGCLDPGHVFGPDALHAVLDGTDLLVVAAPLTDETRGAIDANAFAALSEGAILVNVARGPLVDEAALLDALEAGEIAGAGLDVFDEEPLPEDSPLWRRDDVLVTPHVAGRSDAFPGRLADRFLENYDRRRAGEPLRARIA